MPAIHGLTELQDCNPCATGGAEFDIDQRHRTPLSAQHDTRETSHLVRLANYASSIYGPHMVSWGSDSAPKGCKRIGV